MVFKLALLKVWELLTDTFSRRTDREEFIDEYIKTNDDILKMHKATMLVSKTRQPQTVRFSNGEKVTFSHSDVRFDWSKCKT